MNDFYRKSPLTHLFLSVFLVLSIGLLVSCYQEKEHHPVQISNLYKTARAVHKNFSRTVTGFGYLRATLKRDILAYGPGTIETVFIHEGEKVTKGQKLFYIKGTVTTPELIRIKADFESTKAEFHVRQKEYQRIRSVKNAGASFDKEQEETYANYKKALELFNAAKQKYNFYIKGIAITSPVNGYVTSLSKIAGNAFQSEELLVSIVNLKSVIAEVEVLSGDASLIKQGQSAFITNGTETFSGKVSYVSLEINPSKGSRKAGIEISQREPLQSLPGDFVKAEIVVESHKSSIAIPEESLLNDNGQEAVIVKTGNSYKKRPVVTGLHDYGYVEVIDGIEEGEEVVTTSAYELLNRDIQKKIVIED